ncbi:hypothetical protein [Salinibacter ruber]|uniref:hypothetical protein n=1 Tax=Salinibacter ruber TaxID=146919 RepID=UPI0020744B76|nr:hypothetical protein [Salinibacter ruber]
MSESWLHSTNIILWTACIGLGAGAYAGRLPARMGLLPMFALVPVVLHYGAAWWVQYAPGSLNMPNQAVYDALSDEDQQRVVACTLPYFYGSATLWSGFGIASTVVPEARVLVVALVLVGIVDGVLAVRVLLLKTPRKVRELRDSSPDASR